MNRHLEYKTGLVEKIHLQKATNFITQIVYFSRFLSNFYFWMNFSINFYVPIFTLAEPYKTFPQGKNLRSSINKFELYSVYNCNIWRVSPPYKWLILNSIQTINCSFIFSVSLTAIDVIHVIHSLRELFVFHVYLHL